MKNLAPDIYRQRLIIEGFYTIDLTKERLADYLLAVAAHVDLRTYGEPIVFSPAPEIGKDANAGFDAFVPLIDSGIAAYVWSKAKFFSIVLYTCKGFDEQAAIDFTREYLEVSGEMVSASF